MLEWVALFLEIVWWWGPFSWCDASLAELAATHDTRPMDLKRNIQMNWPSPEKFELVWIVQRPWDSISALQMNSHLATVLIHYANRARVLAEIIARVYIMDRLTPGLKFLQA